MHPARTAAAALAVAAALLGTTAVPMAVAVPRANAAVGVASLSAPRNTTRVEEGVYFKLHRTTATLSFNGSLSWGGDGNRTYTVEGWLTAGCDTTRRYTVWLQYGGTNEKWKDSAEIECSDLSSTHREITVSGTLAPNEKLELRLGTWTFSSWEYSERKVYTPPA
ncbi:hypothetical protein ACIQF6_19645 [Kitasatospora sp. NPDC092948]|uniref:hypothetical protein n=1 Tax=Kitasatospora sp. NPDC092948 TaxID=3364088 RepID=UPI00380A77E9